MLQGMFTTNCLSTDAFLSFHLYALQLGAEEKESSSPHYFLSGWWWPFLRTCRPNSSQQTPPWCTVPTAVGPSAEVAAGGTVVGSCGIF